MKLNETPHLVWERPLFGAPTAAIWRVIDFGVNDWKKRRIIDMHVLTAEQAAMPISELAKLFPARTQESTGA